MPLKDIFSSIEVSRKLKYNLEKYHQRDVPPEIHRVARNLFGSGPADAEEYISQCRKDLDEVNATRNRSWGFDFSAEMPCGLETSTFKWVVVAAAREIEARKMPLRSQNSRATRVQTNRITNYMSPRRRRTTKEPAAQNPNPSSPQEPESVQDPQAHLRPSSE